MRRRQERIMLLLLQVVVFLFVLGVLLFFLIFKKGKANDTDDQLVAEQTSSPLNPLKGETTPDVHTPSSTSSSIGENIPFDPNTADAKTLERVGLAPYQVRSLIHYRQKGGQFHRVEDFKKLYGLTVGQWRHLEPLIHIGKDYQYLADNEDVRQRCPSTANSTFTQGENSTKGEHNILSRIHEGKSGIGDANHDGSPFASSTPRVKKLKPGETLNLSSADTSALQRIPGIGSYYAKRIYEYGQKLGGYVSVDQLNDGTLDFLPVGIEQYIQLGKTNIKKLHINKMSVRELVSHPYINYSQAKQIANRVRLYGPFKTWSDLLFLSDFTEADKARLEPYVSFD